MNRPRVYLDTTVLVVFLYGKHDEPSRYTSVARLFAAIFRKELQAVVSFYTFPELYGYVAENFPRDVRNTTVRHSFLKLFAYPVEIVPFLDRTERRRLARKINIHDPTDFLHVASAVVNDCDIICTYDSHFDTSRAHIEPLSPEELLTELAAE